ncbi:hypothetical protein ACIQLK_11720 [Microbacterium sp. NPDC091382]|uniref:hypothetical protein n=1 Tax=Microbacterium sp. NPDC091382 TaxID=3364210 RepID=UPI00380F7F64
MRRRSPLAAAALLGSALAVSLTGCAIASPPAAPTTTEEAPVAEYGNLTAALSAAVPRIVGVEGLSRSRNGLGERLSATLMLDSAEPFTAEELDAVAHAIWRALPWEPNAIALVAGVGATDGPEPVDLREAAAGLEPMGFTNVGQGGVSLFDMSARYGDWAAPE